MNCLNDLSNLINKKIVLHGQHGVDITVSSGSCIVFKKELGFSPWHWCLCQGLYGMGSWDSFFHSSNSGLGFLGWFYIIGPEARVPGSRTPGDRTPGGSTPVSSTSGGSAPGGSAPGGSATGGSTPGGNTTTAHDYVSDHQLISSTQLTRMLR